MTTIKLSLKALALLLPLGITDVIEGQSTAGAPTPPVIMTTGAFFALSVADINASSRWYAEKLGLSVVMQVPAGAHPAVTVLEGGGLMVELVQHPDARGLRQVAPGLSDRVMLHGLMKAGVIVEDFEQVVSALKSRGVTIVAGPFPKRDGQRANVVVQDDSGNLIQVLGP